MLMGLMLYALLFFLHTHKKNVRWINFKSDKPLQKKEKFLDTVTVISLKLLNVPCKISWYRVDFWDKKK